jgi:serine/threonine protein kinase
MKCPKCQIDNPSDSKYCKECATPLPSSREIDISQTKTLETPREELTTGSTFAGRYQIIEELGHGGMGRIYRAVDKKLNEEVALKLIKSEIASEKRTLERFHNELKLARKIGHPNVGRMYELLEEEGIHFITMEYVPGEDLKSSIKRFGQLPINKSISIAKQICEGLAEAHKIGVIHRDLKPSNIMVDKEGNAKVVDFGIARSLKTKGITGEGVSVGTPEYMSPEQVEGKEADQRADIYSLGIILYEMVTGRVPFEGEIPFSIAAKQKNEQPEYPKKLNPQISDDLNRLILKCLEKDREKRYQRAGEVIAELARIEQRLPTTERAVLKRKPTTSKDITVHFNLRKLLIPIIAITVVAIGAVLLVILLNRQPPKQPIVPSHKQLTFTGDSSWPSISPDGKFLAYVTGQPMKGQKLWVQSMAGGNSIEVLSAEFCNILCWTPDGSEITVYAKNDSNAKRGGTFLVPRLGGLARPLERHEQVAWSSDGSRFAGASWASMKNIKIVNRLTGNTTVIKSDDPSRWFYTVAIDWSPVGDRLLALTVSYAKERKYSIWTFKSDGSQQNKVFEDINILHSPRWDHDGKSIFFLRGKWTTGGQTITELWKLPISSTTGKAENSASLIFSGIPMGASLSLSADGKYLSYTRVNQTSNLLIAKAEGSGKSRTVKVMPLTSGAMLDSSPSISPDKKMVAFSRGSGETMNIYVMPIEGGDAKQVTFLNSTNSLPVWSPDGKEIAFGSDEGGKTRVWKVNADGGVPFQFAETALSDLALSPIIWAPCQDILYNRWSDSDYAVAHLNWRILNPLSGAEIPLIKNDIDYLIDYPNLFVSPDGKNLFVSSRSDGHRVISIDALSERFGKLSIGPQLNINNIGYAMDWSADGKWIYTESTKQGKVEHYQIELSSGRVKNLPTIPFTVEGKTYYMVDEKPRILVSIKTQSDVWVVENFDLNNK